MININLWNTNIEKNLVNSRKILQLLNESFKSKKNLINKKTFVIYLIKNNKIIGTISLLNNTDLLNYLKLKISDEEILNSYIFRASKGIYFYNLAVSKEYRGRGIAQKLIDIALYVSKLKEYEYCHTSCENDISEHLFKKRGFKTEKHFTIGNGSTIRVMSSFI